MTITPTTLFRAAAVAAVAAGLIFIGVQINHPPSDVSAVTTTEWAVRNSLKVLMAALALAGITGMYLRQVKQIGVLGLLGYVVFSIGYLLITSTTVVSAYVLPSLADTDPGYVNDVLAAGTGGTPSGDIGLLQGVVPGAGHRLPGRQPRLRHRAVPRPRTGSLGSCPPVRRWPGHCRALDVARRLLPVPGLPERHRHGRTRLLAVAHRAHRHYDAADPGRRLAPGHHGRCRMTQHTIPHTRPASQRRPGVRANAALAGSQ